VVDAVREAVRTALASASYVPPQEPPRIPEPIMTATAAVSSIAPQPRIEFVAPPPPPPPRVPIEPSGEEIARDIEVMIQSVTKSASSASLPPLNSAEKLARAVTPESLNANIRPLGQLEESFIIATDDEGLLLIDQHVAHERVLFDKYRALEAERRSESQQLLVPETFDLTPAQAAVFDDLAPELENYGFELMRLSGRTVAIKAVPADLPGSEARNMLFELLETVDAEKKSSARETLRDEIAASLACHAAIKVNMPLAPEKMRWLIDRLLQTSSPTTCPHGRPVILRLRTRDILKGFHRI
jgi:DNA mismatch repair protein MutL